MHTFESEGQLERLPDCMRVGRHVRVETSVSRGTATLGQAYVPAELVTDGAQAAAQPQRERVHVLPGPLGLLPSLFMQR